MKTVEYLIGDAAHDSIEVALIPAIRRGKPRGRRGKIGKFLETCRRAKGLWLEGANSFLKEGKEDRQVS